ncbi:MAG: restriction endonuclease [Candidatus Methylarchaceae archaeon HK02M2]|nr:restriction endonuclease [Candidatus Methylarchaceae archaeon HK02M2]
MPKPKVRGRSSERIARGIVEKLGYKILETNKMVFVDEAEAFEVDIIAQSPEGEKYCVEAKAGRAGVSDVRRVFADSELLGLKPMLVCKGFTDEAAEAVAKELGVKMIELSEFYLLLEPEELEVIVRKAMKDVLSEYGFYPFPPWEEIKEEDWELIEGICGAESFTEATHLLHMTSEELGQKIGVLRDKGVFPQREQSFLDLKRHSQQIIYRYFLVRRLDEIENRLKRIEESCSLKQ